MTPSTATARAIVTALLEAGVREAVVAPGSRNAPLSFALFDAARAGLLRLHTRIDERSAAFLALGLTKVGARAAVVCTSGTAVANLHPALLEAAHAGVEVVAVTADRPARLRGTGANQTTDQVGVFGPLVPTLDLGPDDPVPPLVEGGPTHLNVRFDDPLVPEAAWTDLPEVADRPHEQHPWRGRHLEPIDPARRTVVVAGDDARNFRGFGHLNSELAFGHGGAGGQIAWADPATGISLGYCTNGHDRNPMRLGRRGVSISNKAADLCG